MKRAFLYGLILVFAASSLAFGDINEPITVKEWYAKYGQGGGTGGGFGIPGVPGTLWDNGGSNSVNGLTSERNTSISGTGGPEGDHASTIADDFVLTTTAQLTEIRVCLYHDGTTAELYIYSDNGGVPGPSVTTPIFGAPTGPSVVSTTFDDNNSRCQAAFGYPGRQYIFNATTTGVTLPTLNAGRYWLAVVGQGGSRAFWGTSSPLNPELGGEMGSTYFGYPYWSPTTAAAPDCRDFAFDIDGVQAGVSAVPTMTEWGMIIFIILAGLGSIYYLRKYKKV